MKNKIRLLACSFLCLLTTQVFSQTIDLASLKTAKKLTITGGFNLNNLYNSYMPVATNKYSYFLNGTVNFNILGLIDVPLNLNYSNRKFNYSQPFSFNQFSINPKYKWVSAHIGTSSMNFSQYTLSGHQFNGLGFDLTPKNWQISTMVGKLIKSNVDSIYSRMGYGLKVVYQQQKYKVGTSILYAADQSNSLVPYFNRPKKNLVVSLEGNLNLAKFGQLEVEFSRSYIAQLNGSVSDPAVNNSFFNNEQALATNAFKTKLSKPFFNGKTIIGLGYERVDPNYRTFGGYFFTNDFENITMLIVQRMFNNKITFNANVGKQRDLLETKANGQSRFVGSANLAFVPSNKLRISMSYSNFRGFVFIRDLVKEAKRDASFIPIDTLNFTQISRNTSINISYVLKQTENISQNISFNGMVLDAANKQGDVIRTGQASNVLSGQLSYGLGLNKKKININAGLTYNQNKIGSQNNIMFGPTLGIQHQIDKLSIGIQNSYLSQKNLNEVSSIFNASANIAYAVSKNSNLSSSLLLLNNQSSQSTNLPSTIYTINLGYGYKF
jgi:hypothetical protein